MRVCVDPTDTAMVDEVIESFETAAEFGFIYSYANQTGIERAVTSTNPFFTRLKLCTETDFACSGDQAACNQRISRLKAILQSYIER